LSETILEDAARNQSIQKQIDSLSKPWIDSGAKNLKLKIKNEVVKHFPNNLDAMFSEARDQNI